MVSVEVVQVSLQGNLCPVVDKRWVAPHFSNSSQVVWSLRKVSYGTAPATFDATKSFERYRDRPTLLLKVTLSIVGGPLWSAPDIKGSVQSGDGGLRQVYYMNPGSEIQEFQDNPNSVGRFYVFDVILDPVGPLENGHARNRPWAFRDTISWNLRDSGEVVRVDTERLTALELYGVCPSIPQYLFREGLPVDLLRFVFPASREPHEYWEENYAEYITKRVIYDTGFVYDTTSGQFSFASGAGAAFNLHKWIELKGHLDAAKKPDSKNWTKESELLRHLGGAPTLNCYDQAGILLICLSLSFCTDDDWEAVSCFNMRPFGFIQRAHLIGWGTTNNPFFKADKTKMMVAQMDPARTKFKGHVFFSWREKVFDACAGPHFGTETLEEYLRNVQDVGHPDVVEEGRKLTESEITGSVKDAARHEVEDKHKGALGAIEDMVSLASRRNPPPDGLKSSVEDRDLWLDAHELPDFISKKGDLLICDGKMVMVVDFSTPKCWDGEGTMSDKGTHRVGLIEMYYKMGFDGAEYSVQIQWRSYDTIRHAAAAIQTTRGEADDPDTHALQEGVLVHLKSNEENIWMVLHGKHTLQVHSRMASAALKCVAEVIYAYVDRDTKTPKAERHSLGNVQKQDEVPSVTVVEGKEALFEIKTQHIRDVDWSYELGAVFVLDWTRIPNQNGWDIYSLRLYGRRVAAGTTEENLETLYLVFYDRYFGERTRQVQIKVVPAI